MYLASWSNFHMYTVLYCLLGCPIVHCYSNSKLLSVKLYDTTTDKDIDIAKELVHSGSVWPCLKEGLPKLDEGKVKYLVSVSEPSGPCSLCFSEQHTLIYVCI